MIIQKLLFPDIDIPSEMFVRGCKFEDNYLVINNNEKAEFDTYFNIFSAHKWHKYTNVDTVHISVETKGVGTVSVCGIKKSDEIVAIIDKKVESDNFQEFDIGNLSLNEDYEFVYLTFSSTKDIFFIRDYSYSCDAVNNSELKIACCFCTYKREKDILENISNIENGIICNSNSILYDRVHIYISDNGHTLSLPDESDTDHIHLFENKNYGGSAGFTRCLIESVLYSDNDFSHVILMDDDALIKPYVIERTGCFLSALKNEYKDKMIGGALFSKEERDIQIENGAYFNLHTGAIETFGYNKNMNDLNCVIHNDYDEQMNYNGWFYCCIPSSFVRKDNLPLPMFIHGDDIEYGMRNSAGFINLDGICIWHPNPLNTKRAYMSYYDYRARKMIFCSNNAYKKTAISIIKDISSLIVSALCFNYVDVDFQYEALMDFYSGIDEFKHRDAEEKNTSIMKMGKNKSCSIDLPDDSISFEKLKNRGRVQSLIYLMICFIVPGFKTRYYTIDTSDVWRSVNYFATRSAYFINPNNGDGIYYEKSVNSFFSSLKYVFKTIHFELKKHKTVYSEWNERMKEIQSLAFWEDYLSYK